MDITKDSIDELINGAVKNLSTQPQFEPMAMNSETLCENREAITTLVVGIVTTLLGPWGSLVVKAGLDAWFGKHCKLGTSPAQTNKVTGQM